MGGKGDSDVGGRACYVELSLVLCQGGGGQRIGWESGRSRHVGGTRFGQR
jgi:hypothetical protein